MQDLSPRKVVILDTLPSVSPTWDGVFVKLSTTNRLYWCNGSIWGAVEGAPPIPAVGVEEVNFGASPTESASVQVYYSFTTANSVIMASISTSVDTTDHTIDEHLIESIKVEVVSQVAGVGFVIMCSSVDSFGLTGRWSVRWAIMG